MGKDWPRWPEMNWLCLLEGPGHLKVLPIAPTMESLTWRGERYFRMPDSRRSRVRGMRGKTPYGGAYLWDGWWDVMLAQAREGKPADITPAR